MSTGELIASSTGLLLTASSPFAVTTVPTNLYSLTIMPTAAAVVTVLNGAGGTVLTEITLPIGTSSVHIIFPRGLRCSLGLSITLSGTGNKVSATYTL